LVFQNDPSGSIGSISFNLETGATPAMVVPYGSLFEVVPVGPVPEPATAFAGLALIGFIGWRERRRLVPGCSRPGVREINEKDGASHFEPDKSTISLKNYSTGSFDRGAAGWKEALWFVVKCLFFLNPLPWPSALRVALLRAFGAEIGRGVVVRANAHITFPWRLTVGDDVWIGEEVFILSLAPVVIGSNVSISQRAFLCTGSHNFRAHGFDLVTKPINVAHGSWIAAQAFIGPGVSIGQGSMICAGSVVTGNVPPRTMARGNPAVLTAVDQNGEQPCVSSF